MFITKIIMEITIARFIFLVIVFATVIDARVPKNTKGEPKHRNSKSKNRTIVDAVHKSTPTKRDVKEVVTNAQSNNYNNNVGLNNNEPIVLSELLNGKLKALIGEDDATKLGFIKNIKEVLGVNSYENKEDDAIEALRAGDNAEYEMNNSMGRRSNNIDNLATLGFAGHGLPDNSRLLPAHFYRTALLRSLLNNRRFSGFFVNKPQSYARTLLRDVKRTQPSQAKLHIPKQKIQATLQQKQSNVEQFQATQPLQPMPRLPLQRLETETIVLMNQQEIHQPVLFDSNDNAYPYEPIRKR